jgi:excisionase family DNA binding protein
MAGSPANSGPEPGTRFLSVEQVAEMLAVQPSWVYKQVQSRRLAAHKIGHYLRFDPADIEAFIQRSRVEAIHG